MSHKKKENQSSKNDASIVRSSAADGKNYKTKHYQLSGIIAVGYKVNSERAVQFRKWATTVIQEFTIKGASWGPAKLKLFEEAFSVKIGS